MVGVHVRCRPFFEHPQIESRRRNFSEANANIDDQKPFLLSIYHDLVLPIYPCGFGEDLVLLDVVRPPRYTSLSSNRESRQTAK